MEKIMDEDLPRERLGNLETVTKHLIELWLSSREYDDPDSKITMEEFYKKEQEHKESFQKFLDSVKQ